MQHLKLYVYYGTAYLSVCIYSVVHLMKFKLDWMNSAVFRSFFEGVGESFLREGENIAIPPPPPVMHAK